MGLLFPKSAPSVVTRHRRRVEEAAALRDAYADVDQRDAGICWVTGRYTSSGSPDARVRREHHHLVARSLDRTRIDDPTNIITVCAEAHALFKSGWLVSEGTDARQPVFFHWTALAKPDQRPFVIKARRSAHDAD